MSNITDVDKQRKKVESIFKRNFKLEKDNTKIITILCKPKTNNIKLTKEDIEKIKQKPLGDKLIKFRKKLYKKFNSENLKLLNNNIKLLKIKIKYFAPEILLLKFSSGKYNLEDNKIVLLNYFKKGTANHEFFHMASSFYDKQKKIAFSGFQQINYLKKQAIGYGLNEGYTELLNNRYFKEEIKFRAYSYDICTFFAYKLEEIIGKDKMENFYLNADLDGLYKYLTNFDTDTDIAIFILTLDYLVKQVSLFDRKKYERYYELIECYLCKWYINKKQQELNNNIISQDTFNTEIKNYINSLENKDLYLENYVKQK